MATTSNYTQVEQEAASLMSVLRSGNTPRSSSCAKTDDLPSEGVSRSVFSSRSVTLLQPPEINTSNVQVINSGSRELRVVIDPTNSVTCDQIVGESKLGVDLQSSLRSREAGETCDIRTTQSLSPLSPTNNKYLESVATSSSSSASSSISYSQQQQQQRMRLNSSRWTHAEDEKLRQLVQKYGAKSWHCVADQLGPTHTAVQCMCRWKNVLCPDVRKGPWTHEEDQVVRELVQQCTVDKVKWREVAAHLPGRLGKQCRERWYNQLDPSINTGPWTATEDQQLLEAQRNYGNRWNKIAKLLQGRTENAVKNRFNSATFKRWKDAIEGLEQSKRGALVKDEETSPHPSSTTVPSVAPSSASSANKGNSSASSQNYACAVDNSHATVESYISVPAPTKVRQIAEDGKDDQSSNAIDDDDDDDDGDKKKNSDNIAIQTCETLGDEATLSFAKSPKKRHKSTPTGSGKKGMVHPIQNPSNSHDKTVSGSSLPPQSTREGSVCTPDSASVPTLTTNGLEQPLPTGSSHPSLPYYFTERSASSRSSSLSSVSSSQGENSAPRFGLNCTDMMIVDADTRQGNQNDWHRALDARTKSLVLASEAAVEECFDSLERRHEHFCFSPTFRSEARGDESIYLTQQNDSLPKGIGEPLQRLKNNLMLVQNKREELKEHEDYLRRAIQNIESSKNRRISSSSSRVRSIDDGSGSSSGSSSGVSSDSDMMSSTSQ